MLQVILLLLVIAGLIYLLQNSLIKIEPAYKGILVRLGKRTNKILNEGYHFIIPIIHDVIVIDCKRRTENFKINEVFTPEDQAEIIVDVEVTWYPHDLSLFFETKNPLEQLLGMIAEAIRGFASDPFSKPHNWNEAVGMGEKFARMIVAKLMGFEIPRYENDFDSHKKGEHKRESDMTPEELNRKKITIEMVNSLRTGEGKLEIPGIGITITRFNIKAVEPSETLRKALESISAEEQQQEAEAVEARTMARLIKEFLITLGYSEEEIVNPNNIRRILNEMEMTEKELLMIFRIERGKAEEKINRISVDDSIAKIAGNLADRFSSGGK